MQKSLIIIISCFLVSCSSFNGEQSKIYNKLQAWDKILYEKPEEVLDSLETLSSKDLSKKNRAYYSLLITIARSKSDITEKNDSTISVAVDWYKGSKDYKNICRSLLYRGKLIDETNYRDSLLYYNLKEAERIVYKYNIVDNDFKSQINTLLGRIYNKNKLHPSSEVTFERTYKIPEQYIIKSIELNNSLNNQKEVQKAKLELFEIRLQQKKGEEALAILNSLGNPEELSLHIRFELYRAYYAYYTNPGYINLDKSILYLHKIIEISKNTSKFDPSLSYFYRLIATRYTEISKPDSSLFYTKLALKSAEESFERTVFANYKYLADAFAANGDYKSAYENSQKVLVNYVSSSLMLAKIDQKKTNTDVLKMKYLLTKEKRYNYILGISLIVLVMCFSVIIFKSRKKCRLALQILTTKETQIDTLEDELKKTKFVMLLHETLVGALPKLIDDVNKQASRSRKFSSELSDDLNDSISSVRTSARNKLSAITHSKAFLSENPNIKYLTTLSDLEIIILVLTNLKFNVKEISDLLNTTQPSIRAIKVRIKDKIIALKDLPFDPNSTFLIFSKEQNSRS